MTTNEKIVVRELIETMDGYIALISGEVEKHSGILYLHGIKATDADVRQGEVFRLKIAELKSELRGLGYEA